MQTIVVHPSSLQGHLALPSSKSETHRAFLFAALGSGKSTIDSPLLSPDTEGMLRALALLGAHVEKKGTSVTIDGLNGILTGAEDVIQVGNSGIMLRFLSGIAALGNEPIVLTGDSHIRSRRPMLPLVNGLRQLGAEVVSTRDNGFAPFIIRGPLKGGEATVDGQVSQPISSLLIASAFASHPTRLIVENVGEKPWVEMTLSWLERLGANIERFGDFSFSLQGSLRYPGFTYRVPGDWSSAAFPLVAAAVTGSTVSLSPVDLGKTQGDRAIVSILEQMGARVDIDAPSQTVTIAPGRSLNGVRVDANGFTDAVPILAVLGCFADGVTHLTNAAVARSKECDRLHAITVELSKMGARIEEQPDGLVIRPSTLRGTTVTSHNDHRMAMALAVAALGAQGETTITDTACIAKTFPTFVSAFQGLGATLETR